MASNPQFELRPPVTLPRRQPRTTVYDVLKLQKAAQQINSVLELDRLLDMIVNETAVAFGCLEASIWLHDEERNDMVLTGVRGCTMYNKGARLRVGEQGLIGRVAATGQLCYTPDVREDPTYIACEPDTLSEIDIPLSVDGKIIGVFSAVHPKVNGFPPQQVRLLQALAGHIAVAVRNAQLFQRERFERERMHREAQEARLIQQALFPKSEPWVPGFRVAGVCAPAGAVAGDWYDYIPLAGGRWGLVLADVSGKGMPAALLMSATRGILRSLAESAEEPGPILTRLNRVLLEDFPIGKFVTMLYAVLDPGRRTLTFASAGHLWPLFANGHGAEFLETDSGLPLGVAESEFQERRIELPPNSRVLFYTDGITEAANQEEEYGTRRLQALVSRAQVTAEDVLLDVRNFAGPRGLNDDATVILVRA